MKESISCEDNNALLFNKNKETYIGRLTMLGKLGRDIYQSVIPENII